MLTDLLNQLGLATAPAPAVGVSACLAGDAVRYDGTDRFHPEVAGLAGWLDLQRYCPEVGIRLGVPRPTIQMVEIDGQEHVRGVDEPERDFTSALGHYADQVDGDIHGYIFKARSPSCGWQTTPVHDAAGREIGASSGAFNQGVHRRMPLIPFCDEEMLLTPGGRNAFVLRVYCHRHLVVHDGPGTQLLNRSRALPAEYRRAVAEQVETFGSAPD